MKPIATYLFLAIKTTGLPDQSELSEVEAEEAVQMKELSMMAVKRIHVLNTRPEDEVPRVQNRFQLCFSPKKTEEKSQLNANAFNAIFSFIACLEKPVCLISYDAFKYHFPVFQYHLDKLEVTLDKLDISCTDGLYAFFDILETANNATQKQPTTKVKKTTQHKPKKYSQLHRVNFAPSRLTYKLEDIYEKTVKGSPHKATKAEDQCIMLMKLVVAKGEEFVEWVDKNHCPFPEVPVLKIKK